MFHRWLGGWNRVVAVSGSFTHYEERLLHFMHTCDPTAWINRVWLRTLTNLRSSPRRIPRSYRRTWQQGQCWIVLWYDGWWHNPLRRWLFETEYVMSANCHDKEEVPPPMPLFTPRAWQVIGKDSNSDVPSPRTWVLVYPAWSCLCFTFDGSFCASMVHDSPRCDC